MSDRWLWTSAGALALLHLALTLPFSTPYNLPDEAAYLLDARYLAGLALGSPVEAILGGTYFYHAGYSLLVAPAFWLGEAPRWIYGFALALNGVLAALSFVVAAHIAREALGVRHPLAIAWIAALHATALLLGSAATPECALGLCFAFSFWATFRWLKRGGLGWAVLAALAVGFLYWLHPRGLVIAPAWLGAAVWIGLARSDRRRAVLPVVATVAAMLLLGAALNQHVLRVNWGTDTAHSPAHYLSVLGTAAGWKTLLLVGIGQLWYLTTASLGLAVAGAVALLGGARRALRDADALGETLLVFVAPILLVTAASTLTISHFQMQGAESGDYLAFGRINSTYLGLLLLLGLGVWSRGSRRDVLGSAALAAGISLVGGVALFLGWPDPVWRFPVPAYNLLGLGPASHGLAWSAPMPLLGLAFAVTIGGLALLSRWPRAAAWAVGTLFAAAAAFDHGDLASYQRLGRGVLSGASALAEERPAEVALLDCHERGCWRWFAAAQFLMPETRWVLFRESEPVPDLSYVITPRRARASMPGHRPWRREPSIGRIIWVRAPSTGSAAAPGPRDRRPAE